jgi:exodeoxyribonuclease-3
MKCVTWNVNGIRAVVKKELAPWDVLSEFDVICLQETKAQPEQLDPELLAPKGWQSHWHSAEKKGYSGVAIYCRKDPDEVITGLGDPAFDREGRVLAVRYGKQLIVSAYFPNSQDLGKRLDYKLGFCAALEKTLAVWRKKRYQILLMGDYNIAHEPIDLARPKPNEKNAGYLPEERAWFSRFMKLGYVDLYRKQNPGVEGAYTWWSYRFDARSRNVGWRLDYAATNASLAKKMGQVHHHTDILGSDHCPVSVSL